MIKGGVIALLVYFFLIAWIAKLAERRGRMGLAWAGIAAVVGAAAIVGGVLIVAFAFAADASTAVLLLSVFTPMIGMVASMAAVAGILSRLPISTSTRRFQIHDMAAGAASGSLVIDGERIRIEVGTGTESVLLVALREAQADGECIRLAWDDGDKPIRRTYLMGGKPNTPEGRKQQSKVLARRLRSMPTPRAQIRS